MTIEKRELIITKLKQRRYGIHLPHPAAQSWLWLIRALFRKEI